MSLHERARNLIGQAETAIMAGNPQYATELLRQSITYNGKDAHAFMLLGIALAQTGMPVDAENALKKATGLAPDDAKVRYNLAVHQYSQGLFQASLNSSRKAAELDPNHAGATDLVDKLESQLGLEKGEQPKTSTAGNPVPIEFQPGYEEQDVQTMPFVERLGKAWPVIGWLLAAASLAGLLLTLQIVGPYFQSSVNGEGLLKGFGSDPRSSITQILSLSASLGSIAWIAMDAINRRGNLLWLLPQVVCGCAGFTWLVLPIYIFVERRRQGNVTD